MSHTLDPDSRRDDGYCCHADNPVELGDHCPLCGYFIGWIDHDGLGWESRHERDVTLVSERYVDRWQQWNKTGGLLGDRPDLDAIIAEVGILPQHEDEARREAADKTDPSDWWLRLAAAHRRATSRLN